MGGIYTVLSTRAKTLQEQYHDNLLFIGPDLWQEKENPLFLEDATMWQPWVKMAAESGLHVRTGRWNIPGKPCVVLVDFQPYFEFKNDIYGSPKYKSYLLSVTIADLAKAVKGGAK